MSVYLDHAATMPMPPEVADAYLAALSLVGNPSSIHSAGQNAKRMLEESREIVAAAVGASAIELTFTSGGTEAINLALKGLFWVQSAGRPTANRILSTHAEHHATIDALEWLERHEGAVIDWIPVDAQARIDLATLASALDSERAAALAPAALVTTLWANNEVGTIQPIDEIVALATPHGVPVHADAVAALGQVPIDFAASGLAALSISAHKVGGPVGIGALVTSRATTVEPLLHGGAQQRFRSGTQDAAGAVAFATAVTLAEQRRVAGAAALRGLSDRLAAGIRSAVPDAVLRGDPIDRLPGNVHATFPGCDGDSLLYLLDVAGFSVSTGSACQAGVPEASHVLLAMGVPESEARGALRFTLGHSTTEAEIDALLHELPAVVARARAAGLA